MKHVPIAADFTTSPISACRTPHDSVLCLANGYGYTFRHSYHFLDMRNAVATVVDTKRIDSLRKGLAFYDEVVERCLGYRHFPRLRGLASRFPPHPPGLSAVFFLYFGSSPHWITHAGGGRFIVGHLAHKDYVEVDLDARTVTNVDPEIGGDLLSSHHYWDAEGRQDWFMSYSLEDFFRRGLEDRQRPVRSKIWRRDTLTDEMHLEWEGIYADVIDDFRLTPDHRYAVASQIDVTADANAISTSKALVVDLKSGRHWEIGDLTTGAHAEIDCEDPHVIYVSNHNFKFTIRPMREWIPRWLETGWRIEEIHTIAFCGPASLDKFRLTPDGPKFLGRYTREDFTRGSIHWTFMHRGRKLICTVTAPSIVHLVDAETMTLWKALKVRNATTDRAIIFGVYPSQDGELLCVTSTNSEYAQVIRVADGTTEMVHYFPSRFYLGISHPIRVDGLSLAV
ncbi:MAG: hypothetical protein KF901_17670 [Myxococcales bacterium]|nr:hypothetical protein [Myxococcales bacterium]